jgi:hypothetical protein
VYHDAQQTVGSGGALSPAKSGVRADDVSMARVEPEFDRESVNRAGITLRDAYRADGAAASPEESDAWDDAVGVVNNWRSSHAYPLNAIVMTLRTTAARFDRAPLIAQRIKRLVSIAHKLDRFESMRLSQVQDLGGCRAILQNVESVREMVTYYKNESRQKHEIATEDDYIGKPKKSGYRGVHFVFKYHSDKRANAKYNGLKIEMQLRSRYQHAWATAVETVGMFSGQALKSSMGSEEWQRFFTLMGSFIAMREKLPLVPDTPTERPALRSELADYAAKLNVGQRLRGYRAAVRKMQTQADPDASYFLLQLNPALGSLNVTGYAAEDIREASEQYAEAERSAARDRGADSVLVSVESVTNLGRAYPNYFADTRMFLQLMYQALSGHSRGIAVPELHLEQTAVPTHNASPKTA